MAEKQSMEGRPVGSVTARWSVKEETARLECGPLNACLDATQPARGLIRIESDAGLLLDGRMLGFETERGVASQPADTYVRGADFVSTQSGTSEFPFRTQAYWSAVPLTGGVVAATLTLSLQTNLLDSSPRLAVVSQLDAARPLSPTVCVAPVANGVTIAVTPHPTDAVDASAVISGAEHRLWLRPPFLEKGVIRRYRIAALLFFGGFAESDLARAVDEFADLPAPLTT